MFNKQILKMHPHINNAHWVANRISSACNQNTIMQIESENNYSDHYFGNTWDWTPAINSAVYGRTENFSPSDIESLGSGQFMRVPYRRIPIINVHSIDELLHLSAKLSPRNDGTKIVWRGQSKQYSLQRDDSDKLRLYGDTSIFEPSMLPSASRQNVYFPDIFDTWSSLLDIFIRVVNKGEGKDEVNRRADRFQSSYKYRQWGFATAQHYGLPSVGLDVTHDIFVALYFATNCFKTNQLTGEMSVSRATEDEDPVIYAMDGFEDYDLLEDEKISPYWLHCERPKAQSARFFTSGWGSATNRAANRIYVAFRLIGHTKWKTPYDSQFIFPNAEKDHFLKFLISDCKTYDFPFVKDVINKIYYVP